MAWAEAANNDHLKARSTVITALGVQQARRHDFPGRKPANIKPRQYATDRRNQLVTTVAVNTAYTNGAALLA